MLLGMKNAKSGCPIDAELIASLNAGTCGDPFAVLGRHKFGRASWLTAMDQGADRLEAVISGKAYPLERVDGIVFSGKVPARGPYVLRGYDAEGAHWTYQDAYAFGTVISDLDEHLLGEGTHNFLWEVLGAHVIDLGKTPGTHFAVWAPNAQRVSVVGGFNGWDGRRHMMRRRGGCGVWEIFIPDLGAGTAYKFEILANDGTLMPQKADPVGFGAEHPPATASIVRDITGYEWGDADWIAGRGARQHIDAPISIYEVHLGSWRRKWDDGGRPLSYLEAAEDLVGYVKHMGFTHIEFMPISEFPFDGSWGYQPVGLYAPTIRFGLPDEFRALVEAAHAAGLGVLLDWVPGHFPADAHGLGRFDGTALYEYSDPREGFHQDWNTLIYNYGRNEVINFLDANAQFWLSQYHLDGLRVDAVASMLYRDYSRNDGEWVPNVYGGRENLEAISFFRRFNTHAYGSQPGVMTVAEESTAFPGVTSPADTGGLGFGYKWNMGWMNDTLRYIETDPIYRKYHHNQMTFGLQYAFTENFILPISHDEVVHGKGSMLEKMPGDGWEKFANLRAYYGYMWSHPGKKLLFMGCEFAQPGEWNHQVDLDWEAAKRPEHAGIQALVRDLNRVYRENPALHVLDCSPDGFQWIDGGDNERSTLSFVRRGREGDDPIVVICNFTPVERSAFRVGVPAAGKWAEILNTDSHVYGGGNRGNLGSVIADNDPGQGQPASMTVTLPPLSVIMFRKTSR